MSEEINNTDYREYYDPVKCIGDLDEKWCNFKWNIYDLHLNPLETIQSPVFTTRLLPKTYWYLQVQLLSPGNLTAIKISLRRLQTDESVLSIVDVVFKVICYEETIVSDKSTYTYNSETPRNEEFYYIASLRKLKMGCVTIECKLRPNIEMIDNVCHGEFDASLPAYLRIRLLSGAVYDTIIQVGRQRLMAHYAIISARLPQLIPPENHKKEDIYIIEINDLPISVVKEMLKYAYTGQACLDSKTASSYKDILVKYGNFFYTCYWEDHPFAESSFNYETDSLEWNLDECGRKEELGSKRIHLLKIYPNEFELSLDVTKWKAENRLLTLTVKYCSERLPKTTLVSCKYSFVNTVRKERIMSGHSEALFDPNIKEVKMKLYTPLEVSIGKIFLSAEDLILKTDFKFCYGSIKSSIENLYEGCSIYHNAQAVLY